MAESSRLQPAASLENLRASCESTSDQGEGDRTRSPAPHSAATGGASGWRWRDRVSQSSHTPRGTSLPLVTVTLFHAATKCTRSDPGSGSNSPPPTILQISCPPHVGQGHCRAFWTPLCPKNLWDRGSRRDWSGTHSEHGVLGGAAAKIESTLQVKSVSTTTEKRYRYSSNKLVKSRSKTRIRYGVFSLEVLFYDQVVNSNRR